MTGGSSCWLIVREMATVEVLAILPVEEMAEGCVREMAVEVLAILPVEEMAIRATSCDRWIPLLAYKRLPLSDPNC